MAAHGVLAEPASAKVFAMHSDRMTINYVDDLLKNAINCHASDIHIEPYSNQCRIRYRVNGRLSSIENISIDFAMRAMTRLKVMANIDISERRLPQDGKMQINSIDVRVSTCPTIYGEKLVLRLLNVKKNLLAIDNLGMDARQQAIFIEALAQPHGLILITGATGSGKTVTLYAALQHLNSADKNIVTVEDPVEIQLEDITQIQVNTRIGLTFPVMLRALLRQDPDVMIIGEIRDAETATIALQAAQTGHLVLSTLHANTAAAAATRLQGMGIPAHYFVDSLLLVVSQRLLQGEDGERTGVFEFSALYPHP